MIDCPGEVKPSQVKVKVKVKVKAKLKIKDKPRQVNQAK